MQGWMIRFEDERRASMHYFSAGSQREEKENSNVCLDARVSLSLFRWFTSLHANKLASACFCFLVSSSSIGERKSKVKSESESEVGEMQVLYNLKVETSSSSSSTRYFSFTYKSMCFIYIFIYIFLYLVYESCVATVTSPVVRTCVSTSIGDQICLE